MKSFLYFLYTVPSKMNCQLLLCKSRQFSSNYHLLTNLASFKCTIVTCAHVICNLPHLVSWVSSFELVLIYSNLQAWWNSDYCGCRTESSRLWHIWWVTDSTPQGSQRHSVLCQLCQGWQTVCQWWSWQVCHHLDQQTGGDFEVQSQWCSPGTFLQSCYPSACFLCSLRLWSMVLRAEICSKIQGILPR